MRVLSILIITFLVLLPKTSKCEGLSRLEVVQLHKSAREINDTLPKMTSPEIMLVNVFVLSKSQIVFVSKSIKHTAVQSAPVTYLKRASMNKLCHNDDNITMLKKGVIYRFIMLDKNDKQVCDYTISRFDCGL